MSGGGRRPVRTTAALALALALVSLHGAPHTGCAARGLGDSRDATAPADAGSSATSAGAGAQPASPAPATSAAAADARGGEVGDEYSQLPAAATRRRVERAAMPDARPRRGWVPLAERANFSFQLAADGSEDAPMRAAAQQSYCYCYNSLTNKCRKSVSDSYTSVRVQNDCGAGVYFAMSIKRYLPVCWWGPDYAPRGTCKGTFDYEPIYPIPPSSAKCPTMKEVTEGWWEIGPGQSSSLYGGVKGSYKDSVYTKSGGFYWYAETTKKVGGRIRTWSGPYKKPKGDLVETSLMMKWEVVSAGTGDVSLRLTCSS